MVAGAGESQPQPNTFIHADSPATGAVWTSQEAITFDKLKITNNRGVTKSAPASIVAGESGQICLHSMHKYLTRVHVQELNEANLPEDLRGGQQHQPQQDGTAAPVKGKLKDDRLVLKHINRCPFFSCRQYRVPGGVGQQAVGNNIRLPGDHVHDGDGVPESAGKKRETAAYVRTYVGHSWIFFINLGRDLCNNS